MTPIKRHVNPLDRQYEHLLSKVMNFGEIKDTRSGRVKSIFGEQLKFNLKDGFPLVTTKKMYTKGIIHELLWFLQHPYNSNNSMNIEYLVRNNVHIWDDDAYRWFKQEIAEKFKPKKYLVCLNDDNFGKKPIYEHWIENDLRINDENWLKNITKEEFLDLVIQRVEICGQLLSRYRFGDVGKIYGKQWRSFGYNSIDQIGHVINTLKTNPNDRRMLCLAYNPDQLDDMALPPCHVMIQFHTRKLSEYERWEIYRKKHNIDPKDIKNISREFRYYNEATDPFRPRKYRLELNKELDADNIPTMGLSCMWTQRSCDLFLGGPWNIAFYALLTNMISNIVGMEADKLIWSIGDCHIYEAHFDAVKEQLSRMGSPILPRLVIHGEHNSVDDFKFEDFEIVGYEPDPPIKAPLLVG